MNSIIDEKLVMRFDPKTVEHLGLHQYSTLPPVIAELISNTYDADAKNVTLYLNDLDDKTIIVEDDGHGMQFDEINKEFLVIGRDRRLDSNNQKSKLGDRLVIGKKGIGKLSFFGITSIIEVSTVRNGLINVFRMNWDDLKNSNKNYDYEFYEPTIVRKNVKTNLKNGTVVKLLDLKRKSKFSAPGLAYSLSRYFSIFDEDDFEVKIVYNNDIDNPIIIKNKLRYKNISKEIAWGQVLKVL